MTPGAGVDPAMVCKPGKRLRNWHRRKLLTGFGHLSLRALAVAVSEVCLPTDDRWRVAKAWLDSKAGRR